MFAATILPNGVSIGRPPAKGWPLFGTVWQLTQSDGGEISSAFNTRKVLLVDLPGESVGRPAAMNRSHTGMSGMNTFHYWRHCQCDSRTSGACQ